MYISATGSLTAKERDPIIYRGAYAEIARQIHEDGFSAVEMHILDSKEIDREELWRSLRENGLSLSSIGTGSIYGKKHLNLADQSMPVRDKAIEHLRQHMITAQPDHALVIVGIMAGRASDAGSIEAYKDNLTNSLYRLDRLAEEMDVCLGLEIMGRWDSDWLFNMSRAKAYFTEQSFHRISMHIDTFYMNVEEDDMAASIRDCRGLIGHVHIADNNRWYPGHGHINVREILQALSDIQYKGALAMEIFQFPDSRTAGRKGREYLQRIIEAFGEKEPFSV